MKNHSDDPDVILAAEQALNLVTTTLADLGEAKTYDYGGHNLTLGEYDVCRRCTSSIAEAQQARDALVEVLGSIDNPTIREHVEQAIVLFDNEAKAAEIRAKLHNGHNTEGILNEVLAFVHDRDIHDQFDHSHHGGKQ